MSEVTFRMAKTEDGAALLDIHTAAILAVDASIYDAPTKTSWAHGLTAERYADWAEKGCQIEVVLNKDSKILGFCGTNEGEIKMLYVHPEAWGRKIGSLLLAHAEERLAEAGHQNGQLGASLNARGFYERHGWRFVQFKDWPTRGGVISRSARMTKAIISSTLRDSE